MPVPAQPVNVAWTEGRTLIQPNDFTYLGYYDITTNGNNTAFAQGLTARYVGGDLRFLILQYGPGLEEISLVGKTYGQTITSYTKRWPATQFPDLVAMNFTGLWWEEAQQRLWTTSTVDYTSHPYDTQISVRRLNADGTTADFHGPFGLAAAVGSSSINAKRVYGGATAVPLTFQQQYGVGPYAVGFGGYTSKMEQDGHASLGPTLYTMPDPAGYANGAVLPSTTVRTLMDFASPSQHRGTRLTLPDNDFESGWQSPAADGTGWFVWGESYYNTGNWIETPTRYGFILIASLGKGRCWYEASTLHYDARQFELHIFDPARFGEVLQGTRQRYEVRPSSMIELMLPGTGTARNGNGPKWNVAGATFDAVSSRLYVLFPGVNASENRNRLFVYQVAA